MHGSLLRCLEQIRGGHRYVLIEHLVHHLEEQLRWCN